MSGGHAPYIMPDGGKLKDYLRADRERDSDSKRRRSKSGRAKDDLWQQLQRNKVLAGSDQELQEIRSIERAGHRRRQRWLNDKILRDMAGPLTARTMEAQFNPVPFGSYPPPSAFEIAMQEPLWEHFRNIDLDKEARVLQRWEQHNHQQQQDQQQQQQHSSPAGPLTQHQQQAAAAADALDRWRAVGRSARAALKKANVHSVLELEMQIIEMMEQGDPHAELLLDLPDGFARLIVHGLAQFHNLTSTTRLVNSNKYVVISRRTQQQPQQQPQQQQRQQVTISPVQPDSNSQQEAAAISTADAPQGSSSAAADPDDWQHVEAPSSTGADWLMQHVAITCTDVVMALRELGGSFDQPNLMQYMKTHVHGSSSDDFHML